MASTYDAHPEVTCDGANELGELSGQTLDQCKQACSDIDNCISFQYKTNQTCQLSSSCTGAQAGKTGAQAEYSQWTLYTRIPLVWGGTTANASKPAGCIVDKSVSPTTISLNVLPLGAVYTVDCLDTNTKCVCNVICPVGTYLPKHASSCKTCPFGKTSKMASSSCHNKCNLPTTGSINLPDQVCHVSGELVVSGHLAITGSHASSLSEISNSAAGTRLFKVVATSDLGKSLTLTRIKLTGGKMSVTTNIESFEGGSIYLERSLLEATSVWFAGCGDGVECAYNGGSIYSKKFSKVSSFFCLNVVGSVLILVPFFLFLSPLLFSCPTTKRQINISDSALTRTKASNEGGSIYHFQCSGQSVRIHNTLMAGNAAPKSGCLVIQCDGGSNSIELTSNIFYSNVANGKTGEGGAALFIKKNTNVNLNNTLFLNNTAEKHGGAIAMDRWSVLWLFDSEFRGNKVLGLSQKGGAIFIKHGDAWANPSTMSPKGQVLHVENSTFVKNSAHNGGAIYIQKAQRFHVLGSIFEANEAGGNGGAICIEHRYSSVLFTQSFKLERSQFRRNQAVGDGGALWVYMQNNNVPEALSQKITNLHHVVFESNVAKNGGAVSSERAPINMVSCNVSENTAQAVAGGGIGGGKCLYSFEIIVESIRNKSVDLFFLLYF